MGLERTALSTSWGRIGPECLNLMPWCINTGKSLIPLTLRFLAQKRNLLIPLELSRVMHQGRLSMVNVGKLWRGRRRDDGEGFEGVVALALTLPSGCALEGASAVKCWWPPRNLFVC